MESFSVKYHMTLYPELADTLEFRVGFVTKKEDYIKNNSQLFHSPRLPSVFLAQLIRVFAAFQEK
jgi:hypothetical protein